MTGSVAYVEIGDETTTVTVGDETFEIPCGAISLGARHIVSDPPLPEELTNAIGEMVDHVDDVKRELPAVSEVSSVIVAGTVAMIMADIEVGTRILEPDFLLDRDAAEDVFRTLATEAARDRRHNPGLPPDVVDSIVGGCCVVVGLIRGLQLDAVTVRVSRA
jgi:exopolyphosphatase/guanosine-5'-triphosphate,3'-diphosphate pyrophosphatase